MRGQPIPRVVAKILIPQMMIFGLYVHFHGDYGPGGGFQAGVILAASVILYALIFGLEEARRVVPMRVVLAASALGVLLYAGTGVAGLLLGGAFMDYDVLAGHPVDGQHRGILFVELGVVVTVFGAMMSLFYAFAGRGRREA